ncbi:MAG: HAMP domain-containing sensor histidine kinase [Candidatus Fimivivens sp.]|nr:HAMP domain-containing sensor histidine kinase [Candidatus Fimivivens sp.]
MLKGNRSIERRIVNSLLGYTLFIIALLWVFQIILLKIYYQIMQKASIMQAGNQILNSFTESDFETQLEHICFSHGMSCVIIDSKGEDHYSIDMLGRGSLIHSPAKATVVKMIEPIINGDKEEIVVQVKNKRFRNDELIYAHSISDINGEKFVLILNASLDPVESTTDILKSQLRIIIALLIVVAYVMSKLVAKRLSQPIKNITQKAKGLATGDYTADYEGGGVTEIDELAQALNFSAEGLSKVEDLRRELVANISHDLKTPLTMIKAYAEMIRDLTGENKKNRDLQLDVIITEADRLTRLVTDLIQISRDENETRRLIPEVFNLSKMISDITIRFEQTNPDYTIEIYAEPDKLVFADKESIGQVLYNLISNAINYTGADKTVQIALKEVSQKWVRVEIKDSGLGISKEELPLIWERYYRSRNTHQRAVAGSGLGLSIVKKALSQQNLPFGVKSEVQKGSCFWFEVTTMDQKQ